ncbi:membrane hypothetical protein [Vibrio coralliirubri]|uniref:acyltransferase family protein n=1 Tax=Vibrio coralliirubri TaxID=1516159 RepID=UPI000635D30D|nr:acyltransferase [Vibrio coralliirubri]CDT40037.1 membrane hypothetical protein [Vibrio coralliirubri]
MLSSIHALRGIASVMVFFAHYRTIDGLSSRHNEFFSMGAYGVDIFFVISGFVVCLMVDKLRKQALTTIFQVRFILSRFVRVIIPLWAAIFLQYTVVGDYSGVENLVKSIFLIPSENTYYNDLVVYYLEPQWSLVFEILFYAVLAVFLLNSRVFLYSGILLISLLIPKLFGVSFYISNPIIIEFIFGIVSYELYKSKIFSKCFIDFKFLYISVFAFILFSFLLKEQAGNINSFLRVFTVGVSCFFIVTILSNNEIINISLARIKLLTTLGNYSYSLYLVHMISFRVFDGYFSDYGLIALFILVFSMTATFYYVIDNPCHKLSKYMLKND